MFEAGPQSEPIFLGTCVRRESSEAEQHQGPSRRFRDRAERVEADRRSWDGADPHIVQNELISVGKPTGTPVPGTDWKTTLLTSPQLKVSRVGPDSLTVNVVLSTTTHVWGDAGGEHSSPVTVTSNPFLQAAARSKLSSSNGMRREKLTGGRVLRFFRPR